MGMTILIVDLMRHVLSAEIGCAGAFNRMRVCSNVFCRRAATITMAQ